MAKAKKTESTEPIKKKATKSKSATPASGAPVINTSLAADMAAKMISAKVASAPAMGGAPANQAPKESSAFKNMKQGLANPAGSAMANFLDKTGGPVQKKSNVPNHGGKQVGRNQTFGADVARAGVPRRTAG